MKKEDEEERIVGLAFSNPGGGGFDLVYFAIPKASQRLFDLGNTFVKLQKKNR